MKKEHQTIWINLRAEVIKHFHDTRNAGKFKDGFPYSKAKQLAEFELSDFLEIKWFVLTLDEMLLLSLEECVCLAESRFEERIKSLLNYEASH